ncbi:MAG: trigger factor [Acidimicrobiales bacterium]
MRATAEPEEGNKVRLSVEIDELEIDEALGGVIRRLSREVRVPGFRPGKVPRRVIEARMGGATALRAEAIREALPDFYARALSETEIDPIDHPEIDITSEGDPGVVSFDAVVEVRPTVSIAGYQGLVVTIPALDVPEEEVTEHIDRLRSTSGELAEVDRQVRNGDQVTIDIIGVRAGPADGGVGPVEPGTGDADLSAEDFLYEVGSARVVPELDEQLIGVGAGDTFSFDSSAPGLDNTVSFTVTVKSVKELVLPDVTDQWASEASEFSTVEELKADVTNRLGQRRLMQAQLALKSKAIEALAELVTEDLPSVLVESELRQRLSDLGHRLDQQGMNMAQFLAASGREEDEFLEELRASAVQGVKTDLALRSLADLEHIELTDEELETELATMGRQLDMSAEQVRNELEQGGRLSGVRSDRRKAKAARWLFDNVDLADEDGAPIARDDLKLDQADQAEEAAK